MATMKATQLDEFKFASGRASGPAAGGAKAGLSPAVIATGQMLTPEQVEERLRAWDHTSEFGPAIGMTRRERWERAHDLGLNPPPSVLELLDTPGARQDCLWAAYKGL